MSGCSEEAFEPGDSFSKIYDHSNGDLSFRPVDVAPLGDGYIILTEKNLDNSDFTGASIYVIDEFGEFRQELDVSGNYVLPTGPLTVVNEIAYFFAMEPVTLNTVMLSVTPGEDFVITPIPLSVSIPFPLAANAISNDRFLLLSYNTVDLESTLSTIGIDGTVTQTVGYSIGPGSDVEAAILNHYTDPERNRLHFFCGEYSTGNFYFNGFYNYSLSMVFTNLSGTPSGVIQGQGTNGGISEALPLGGNTFSILGYQFNDTFLNANADLNTGGISSSIDLFTNPLSEFRSRTRSSMEAWTDGSASATMIAAETEARQIAIYCYSTSGVLSSIQRVGFINPYTVSSIQTGDDGSLLLVGTTFVSGRFERMFLQKFDGRTVANWVK
jgi:hypothetical protein